jgi:hypothetical protein
MHVHTMAGVALQGRGAVEVCLGAAVVRACPQSHGVAGKSIGLKHCVDDKSIVLTVKALC